MQGTRYKLQSCRVEQEDTVAGRYPGEWSARGGVSVSCWVLEACGMPGLREICRKQTIYVNKQSLLRAGQVVSQWWLLIGTGRESGEISEGKESKQARRGNER